MTNNKFVRGKCNKTCDDCPISHYAVSIIDEVVKRKIQENIQKHLLILQNKNNKGDN